MQINHMYYRNGEGPMLSYFNGKIDLDKARQILLADDEIKEIINNAIECEYIEKADDIFVRHFHIGPMNPAFDGDIPIHLDEDGNPFWEPCERSREGAIQVTGIDWYYWFI